MRRIFPLLLALSAMVPLARADVVIEAPGAESALLGNLRARLSLAGEGCDAPRWRVRRLFGRAGQEFETALRAFGYYRATVEKHLETAAACWHARFDITLGTRVKIRKRIVGISGEAAQDDALIALLQGLPLPEGAPLNHGEYEAIKDQLRQFAVEQGYLDFAFTRQELRVYPKDAVADIHLEADFGARYRFGELSFSGQTLDEDFVRRLAKVREGEPFGTFSVTAIDRHLSESGYFRQVEVRPRRSDAEDGRVPVDILLQPALRHAWRAGIGFATDTGPRASLRYDNRYVNHRGHRFESALSVSPALSGLSGNYVVPGEDPHRDSFSFGARLEHEDTDSTLSDSAVLALRHTIRSESRVQTRFLELLHEHSTVADEKTTATLFMPGIMFDQGYSDNPLLTRRGYRVRLELRAAHDKLLSTATLLQLRGHAKGMYRFGDAGRVTARVDAGASLLADIDDLPASLRFFAGGDNSVRGYAYKSLGPLDADGEVRGGKHLLTGSVEYEHPVAGDEWWVAAFLDAGNAFDTDEVQMRTGYGLGVRWYSPVGRVRLDLAFPDDTEKDSWRLHFGLGADL